MTDSAERPKPKGRRPYFFDDPAIDQLHAALLAVTQELAVARERIDTLERLLAEKQVVPTGAIDGYQPDEAANAARSQLRADLARRVLAPFVGYRDELFARAEHADVKSPPD
jgi:hypothetical protein